MQAFSPLDCVTQQVILIALAKRYEGADLAERIQDHLKLLDGDYGGSPVDRC